MSESIKCPKCKGEKFSLINATTVKCAYCGHVYQLPGSDSPTEPPFAVQKAAEQQPAQDKKPQIKVVVDSSQPMPPTTPENSDHEENDGEGKRMWYVAILVAVIAIIIICVAAKGCNSSKVEASEDVVDSAWTPSNYDEDEVYVPDTLAGPDEVAPDPHDSETIGYAPDVDKAKRAVKTMYHEIIADLSGYSDGARMRKKYLSEDLYDLYERVQQFNQENFPGELAAFDDCDLLTQSNDCGRDKDIRVVDVRYDSDYYQSGYYIVKAQLWGRPIDLVVIDGTNGHWYIDDINGWKHEMSCYLLNPSAYL